MNLRDFRKAGHWPSLLSAFLYFDTSFAIWVLVGALAVSISADFWPKPPGLSMDEHLRQIAPLKNLMLAVPLLGGSILRVVLGLLTDRIGARRTGLIGMGLTAVPLLLGWLWVELVAADAAGRPDAGRRGGELRRRAAAGQPLVSAAVPGPGDGHRRGRQQRHGPGHVLRPHARQRHRLARGLRPGSGPAGADASWRSSVLAKDSPNQPAPKPLADYGRVLGHADTWWFCLFYSVTFGGFVGLASFLNTFFKDQYFPNDPKTGAVYAGYFTTLCVIVRLVPAAGRRLPRRPLRRHPHVARPVPLRGAALAGLAFLPPLPGGRRPAVRGDGPAGNGQRFGVPARAAALPEGDRRHDRRGRGGRRRRRLLPAERASAA